MAAPRFWHARIGAVALGVATLAPVARAEVPVSFELAWDAPADCPSETEVRAAVLRLLRSAPASTEERLFVRARAREAADGTWHGSVQTKFAAQTGERELDAESCRALAESTALIVALIIDPRAAEPPAAEDTVVPTPLPPAPPVPPPKKPIPQPSRTPARRPRRLRVLASPLAAADFGTLPDATYGFGGRLAAAYDHSTLELGLLAWKSQQATTGTVPPEGATIGLLSAFASVCPAGALGRFDLGGCATFELGYFHADGIGQAQTYTPSARGLGLGAGALGRFWLTHAVALSLRTEARIALDRPIFVVRGVPASDGQVHQPAQVAGRAIFGIDFAFEP
jgi:hypothetical protein